MLKKSQPVPGRARRCWRAQRDFEEPGDLGDFCRRPLQLIMSGKARVTNRIENLILSFTDHHLESQLVLFCTQKSTFSHCVPIFEFSLSPRHNNITVTQDHNKNFNATESSSYNPCNQQTNASIGKMRSKEAGFLAIQTFVQKNNGELTT